MSTRAVVAIPLTFGPDGAVDTWEGVYVHSDGYPSGVGADLLELHRVHEVVGLGFAFFAACVVVDERRGYSILRSEEDPAMPGWPSMKWPDGSYSRRYSMRDSEKDGEDIRFRGYDDSHWDIDWLYLLTPDYLIVQYGGDRPEAPMQMVPWDSAPDWSRIEARLTGQEEAE